MAIRLHYFNARNRAEFIRWILAFKGIHYEDTRIEFSEWGNLKSTFEFGQVPALDIDGKRLVTAISIGRYLAQRYGLYPSDIYLVYLSESLIDLIGDFLQQFEVAYKEKNFPGWDEYLRTEGLQKLKIVERRLKASGTNFLVGSTLSLVDFVVTAFIHNHYFGENQEHRLAALQAEAPALKAYVERFLLAAPEVAEYIHTRPSTLF